MLREPNFILIGPIDGNEKGWEDKLVVAGGGGRLARKVCRRFP